MSTRTDRNQTFDSDGNVIAEELVEVDTTDEVNEQTLRQQAHGSLTALRTSIDTLKAHHRQGQRRHHARRHEGRRP
jgi:hypothetical protein